MAHKTNVRTQFLPDCLPPIGEAGIAEAVDSLRSGWETTGPKVKRIEDESACYPGAKHAVAAGSCMAAVHAWLDALDAGPEVEAIVPASTLRRAAILPVHYGGQACPLEETPVPAPSFAIVRPPSSRKVSGSGSPEPV